MAETTAKKDSLIARLDKVLTPIGQKLGNEKHLQAISNGMLFGLPFLVIGSFFLIVSNPPIVLDRYNPRTTNIFMQWLAGWKYWAMAHYAQITIPYNMTMGVFGMICAFGIAYELSKAYRRLHPATDGMISLVTFLMVATTVDKNNKIIIGLLAVEINRGIEKSKLKIKLPDSIPPMVANFINSLIPLLR